VVISPRRTPERDDQVGVAHALGQLRVDADAHVAGVQRMAVVEGVLEAEAASHRQLPGLGKALQTRGSPASQPLPPAIEQGPLRAQQQARAGRAARRARARPAPAARAAAPARGGRGQHVLGQHQHHRAGAALQRGVEGARHVLGQAVGVLHLGHPLGHAQRAGAEHLAVVDFLEGLAVALIAGHLADEQHQRR
jgi:hypothetical protein